MFERFTASFRLSPAGQSPVEPFRGDRPLAVAGFDELMAAAAGCTFDDGLYRLHSASTGRIGQDHADATFPQHRGRMTVFAFDWLGRQFALDAGRVQGGEPLVLLLEPGSGEALEIPVTFAAFHDEELVDYRNEALASDFFAEWAASHRGDVPLELSQCVGYEVPLFLGGQDTVGNLELTDFDVCWSFAAQLRAQTRSRPDGTPIGGVGSDG